VIKVNIVESNLLFNLFKSNGKLESYTLFKRSKTSIKEFTTAVNRLTALELIKESDNLFILTKTGKSQVLASKLADKKYKPWRAIPSKYKIQQYQVNEPYVPSISMLDDKTFN